jgi:hypothetical protein
MTTRWNDLVALAREIDRARSTGAPIDLEQARRLAREVLAMGEGGKGRFQTFDGSPSSIDARRTHG